MKDGVFRHVLRVPYAHIDKMGFVYYANYLIYFEMARAQMLREAGLPYTQMEERGVFLPVVSAACTYRRPACYDDELTVLTQCTGLRRSRLHLVYRIVRTEDGQGRRPEGEGDLICTGETEHVCMGADGKVMRPIPELRSLGTGVG